MEKDELGIRKPVGRMVMKNTSLLENKWHSVNEIADYPGVRRETIYVWLERKGLPGHRIGKFGRFRQAEINAWVKSGVTGSTK